MSQSAFDVPQIARSSSGAHFFEQHAVDLRWAIGQDYLAREYEDLTSMIVDAVRKLNPDDWSRAKLKADEVPDIAALYFEDRAQHIRKVVSTNHEAIFEILLCRYADNFLCYLADLLAETARLFPNVVISKDQQVLVHHVLEHSNIDSFKAWFIEKKVSELSFGGLADILNYFSGKFGILLLEPSDDIYLAVLHAIGIRNLLVHRRGIVDDRFIKANGPSFGAIGERVKLEQRVWDNLIPAILLATRLIDARAANKFNLKECAVTPVDPLLAGTRSDRLQKELLRLMVRDGYLTQDLADAIAADD